MRILIADDHPLFRDGIAALLRTQPDLEAVGTAADTGSAVQQAIELRPDLVLMDVAMPGGGGVEATRRIVDALPDARILMVTMFDDDTSVFAAMRAGARGYVLKDAEAGDLLRAVRAAGNGDAIFSPAIAARLMTFFGPPRAEHRDSPFPVLTEREREILDLVARGRGNLQIATEMHLSHSTVRNYVSSILRKLQVASRAEAIAKARDVGLGEERG
ncbi:response regulator transcription factor [Amnibacterium sp.]|uniref:response regulator n=1 Tax=Amnibacterium sp. TaxID=1872496 RepID=UPI002601DB2A|nr:response regulator transcription factor [Amnibacterium sp.]MCU1473603.1 response regulator transcription factor [Amnibacterium sp.]